MKRIGIAALFGLLVFVGTVGIIVLGVGSVLHQFKVLQQCQYDFFCRSTAPAPSPAPATAAQLQAAHCAREGKVWDESLHGCVPPGFEGKVRPAKKSGEVVNSNDVFIVKSGNGFSYLVAEERENYGFCLFWFWNKGGELGGCFPTYGQTGVADDLGRVFKNTRNEDGDFVVIPEPGREIWVVLPVKAYAQIRTAQLVEGLRAAGRENCPDQIQISYYNGSVTVDGIRDWEGEIVLAPRRNFSFGPEDLYVVASRWGEDPEIGNYSMNIVFAWGKATISGNLVTVEEFRIDPLAGPRGPHGNCTK